jgi:hypothetical protein
MEQKTIKCTVDRNVITRTRFVAGLVILFLLMPVLIEGGFTSESSKIIWFAVLGLLVFVIGFGFLSKADKIEITRDSIIIKSKIRKTIIPKDTIKEIRPVNNEERQKHWRLFAGEGIFCNYGWYKFPKEGKVFVNTTRSNNWT